MCSSPPDANTLLHVVDDCLRSRNLVNVIVAGKQPSPQWLDMDAAIKHCSTGIGIWNWASSDRDTMPDVVMACCGDVPTLETLAAVALLREHVPDPRVRGYKEESTTTTPFDMVVRNDLARYDLVADVVDRVERLAPIAAYAKQVVRDKLVEHHAYIERHGEDLPAIRDWVWPY